ncbi:hypothetical protein FRB94_002511 [Tulasnella sp. JGI-2019a]|nr:hypothetical protein FRB94_002511 [Tulasnella sp. JGI-2019a]
MDSPTNSKPDVGGKDASKPLELHVDSEFFSQLVYFKVDTTLFNVSDALLPGRGYLASVTKHDDRFNGTSMFCPIPLNITISEMNSIMRVLHARQVSAPLLHTIKQWSEALHVATIWDIASAREYIIDRISALFPDQPPIDRIVLADRCGVKQWFYPAYEELCVRRHPPTTEEGIERLGVDRIVAIFTIRETLRAPASSLINDTMRCGCPGKTLDSETVTAHMPNTLAPVISTDNASRMIRANRVLRLTVAEQEDYDAISMISQRDCCIKTSEESMSQSRPRSAMSVAPVENNFRTSNYVTEAIRSRAPSRCASPAFRPYSRAPSPPMLRSYVLSRAPSPATVVRTPSPVLIRASSPIPPIIVEDIWPSTGLKAKKGKKGGKKAAAFTPVVEPLSMLNGESVIEDFQRDEY